MAISEATAEQSRLDERELALAMAGTDERVWAIVRAAYAWGFDRGWREGFERSFESRPRVGSEDARPWEEVVAARGEVRMPDGTYRTIPRAGDRQGGGVAPW